jgi:hypothetical protein
VQARTYPSRIVGDPFVAYMFRFQDRYKAAKRFARIKCHEKCGQLVLLPCTRQGRSSEAEKAAAFLRATPTELIKIDS